MGADGKPHELDWAELILGLCDRFHCLPSALEEEEGLLWMLAVERTAREARGEV